MTVLSDTSKSEARFNFRLPKNLKTMIERAAAHLGQTVSGFAISTLAQTARQVIREHDVTEISHRDRDRFITLLDDVKAEPNKALKKAAKRYKERA